MAAVTNYTSRHIFGGEHVDGRVVEISLDLPTEKLGCPNGFITVGRKEGESRTYSFMADNKDIFKKVENLVKRILELDTPSYQRFLGVFDKKDEELRMRAILPETIEHTHFLLWQLEKAVAEAARQQKPNSI